ARPSLSVHHDDLTVYDEVVIGDRFDRAGDLGEDGCVVVALARDQNRFAARLAGDEPIPVELELEQPAVARERVVRGLGEHDLDGARIDAAFLRARPFDRGAQPRPRTATLFHLVDGETGKNGRLDELIAGLLHPGVSVLDPHTTLLALLVLHERPLAVELVLAQLEQELSFRESFLPVLKRHPLAAVPDDDAASPVVARGNNPFEVTVFDRVIL